MTYIYIAEDKRAGEIHIIFFFFIFPENHHMLLVYIVGTH